MSLSKKQLEALLQALKVTADKEINCNEFLDLMAEYAELEMLGQASGSEFDAFRQHLELCVECREEYEALVRALGLIDKCKDEK